MANKSQVIECPQQMNERSPGFEPLLDSKEAARLLGIHSKTLQQMARRGEVPAVRVGRFWRFRASVLDGWIRAGVNS